jgi:hypothetical protein
MVNRRLALIAGVIALAFSGAACLFRYADGRDPTLPTHTAEVLLRQMLSHTPPREDVMRGRDWLRLPTIWTFFEPRLAATMTVYWLRKPDVPLCGKSPFRYGNTEGLKDLRIDTVRTSPVTARVTFDYKHYGQTAGIAYDLVATRLGWRIDDVSWRDGIWITGYPPEMTARQFLSTFTWKWPLLECDVA